METNGFEFEALMVVLWWEVCARDNYFRRSAGPFDFVIIDIPIREPANPFLYGCGRLEPDVVGQVGDVGEGCRNIAGLHWQEVLLRLASKAVFQHLDEVEQLDR